PASTPSRPMSAPADDSASSQECFASARRVPDTDGPLVAGHDLVSDNADSRAGDAPAQVVGGTIFEQFVHTLDPRERGADPDHDGDPDAGEVLGALIAVGVALAGAAFGHPETDEHDQAGRHVGQV